LIISTYYLYEKFVAVSIQAHHKLRCAEMWCACSLFMCLICHAPRLGDILSCHWLDIIAPQYRLALSLQEATNIAGTPPQVCGRSWESIIITYVCHRTNRAIDWSNGCILSLWLCNAHPYILLSIIMQEHYSNRHGDAHYVALPFSHIRSVLKIPYI